MSPQTQNPPRPCGREGNAEKKEWKTILNTASTALGCACFLVAPFTHGLDLLLLVSLGATLLGGVR